MKMYAAKHFKLRTPAWTAENLQEQADIVIHICCLARVWLPQTILNWALF